MLDDAELGHVVEIAFVGRDLLQERAHARDLAFVVRGRLGQPHHVLGQVVALGDVRLNLRLAGDVSFDLVTYGRDASDEKRVVCSIGLDLPRAKLDPGVQVITSGPRPC